jgi:hypothetical protein
MWIGYSFECNLAAKGRGKTEEPSKKMRVVEVASYMETPKKVWSI